MAKEKTFIWKTHSRKIKPYLEERGHPFIFIQPPKEQKNESRIQSRKGAPRRERISD
jgi:hypothetical protein